MAADLYDKIPTEEIIQDIRDTNREISELQLKYAKLLGASMAGRLDKLEHMRMVAAEDGIKERQEFVIKLKWILENRRLCEGERMKPEQPIPGHEYYVDTIANLPKCPRCGSLEVVVWDNNPAWGCACDSCDARWGC